ncbi:MAG: PBS lyase, partial [Cyanobacteriota bacterium]|nr:PBS lyase [Cyanobacteriota bacterium]
IRDRFTDSEFFEACRRLSQIVSDRNITVLLAKLYAEQLIAARSNADNAHLPDTIPDLMLSYLDELSRDRAGENGDRAGLLAIRQDAKIVAWECVKSTYQAGVSSRQDVLAALGEEEAEERLQMLENRLHLIQFVGSGKDKIRFSLEPLAEYLAALYLIEDYGQDRSKWRNFLRTADTIEGAPQRIESFLLAVRDCCLVQETDSSVPPFVLEELNRRIE